MKHIRQHVAQRKVVWENKIVVTTIKCGKLPVNETVETPVTSTYLSIDCLELKTDRMASKLLHIK
jgi:hypothetical protein